MTHNKQDKVLARIIKEELPEAPKDEWFVKKTMNRLPEKRSSVFSKPEIVCYILSAIIIVTGWAWLIYSIHTSGVVTITNIIICAMLFFSVLLLSASIAIPLIRRS